MTVIQELKTFDGCGGGTGSSTTDCTKGVLAMKCCTTDASSKLSIDEISAPSTSSSGIIKIKNLNANELSKGDTIFSRCKEIDLEFENLKYTVRKFSFAEKNFITKEILHGINGVFRSGELSAVMGPSGSGKSTLLNILSGFRISGSTGTVKVNGKVISTNSEKYRELSCYIIQDDMLRSHLTVGETMMLAANLKLGYNVTKVQKENLINNILSQLSLQHRYNVFVDKLSGGQKKRLAIALELISNPPVLYLDEPTTGLDSSSCSQCIDLLKKLASQGHTIICTIHQPSAMLFERFDKLYTLVDGYCMYQGPVKELIPFLADQNLLCPTYHNPADYLLEVAVGDHNCDLDKLINAANKKYHEDVDFNRVKNFAKQIHIEKLELGTGSAANKLTKSLKFLSLDHEKQPTDELVFEEMKALKATAGGNNDVDSYDSAQEDSLQQNQPVNSTKPLIKPASFFMQYLLLLNRNLICVRRNYGPYLIRLTSHILVALLFGYIYRNVGVNANTALANYVYIYGTLLLTLYTGKMPVILTCKRNYTSYNGLKSLNERYGLILKSISLSKRTSQFDRPCICVACYAFISLHLTGNDLFDENRIYYFVSLCIMVSITAQAYGFFFGANFPTKLAIFLGPVWGCVLSVFGFCSGYLDITPLFRWMWHISFMRAGLHGILNTLYGMNRKPLDCPENMMYCHFHKPKYFLKFMKVDDVNMFDSFTTLFVSSGIVYLLTLIILWYKLNKR
uniref:ABC transporter domain-containing protein n=1 Tax=Glossina brevipalpis TaxID=37001 RepID=A0A1A9WZY2_9MUSC